MFELQLFTMHYHLLSQIRSKFQKWYQKLPSYLCANTRECYQAEANTYTMVYVQKSFMHKSHLTEIAQDIRVIYIQTHQCLNYNYSLLARQHPPAAPLASLAKQSYYTYLLWRTKVDVLLIPDFGFCNIVIYTIELSL